MLADTGIRVLRERPVFTTPNVYPPKGFEPGWTRDEPSRARDDRGAALLRLQAAVPRAAPVLRPALPAVRRVQLREALGDRRPRGPRRGADGRPGQDRLPGGDQAAPRRRPPDRDDALPPRLGRPLRAGGRFRRLGATGSRSTGSTCATRRASRRSATTCSRPTTGSTTSSTTPARPSAGRPTSTATCSMPSSRRSTRSRPRCSGCSAPTRGCAATTCSRARSPSSRRPGSRCSTPAASSAELSQVRLLPEEASDQGHLFPEGQLDQDLQQVDLRDRNSWRFLLAEVSTVELLETQLVNAVAPFVLNARLKPLHARARPTATSTSSTSRRSRGSSTGASRRRATRTRTWPRRR